MRKRIYEIIPDIGKAKVDAFCAAYNIYFRNQKDAGDILKVGQATISRYLEGSILVPMEVAVRFEKHTNGLVSTDSIFFDYKEYKYDLKQKEREIQNHKKSA